jgi:hypothetical protein
VCKKPGCQDPSTLPKRPSPLRSITSSTTQTVHDGNERCTSPNVLRFNR